MAKKEPKKIARQERLPGMKDAKISALQNAALDYAEIRDQRQELTKQEVDLKTRVINLMHKHGKDTYDYQNVHIELVTEEETVKVRIKRQKVADDSPVAVSSDTPEAAEVEEE